MDGAALVGFAAIGLVANAASFWVLSRGDVSSLNLRGALNEVTADLLGSALAIAAGVAIWVVEWRWADPVASVLISLLVIYSSWRLLAESVSVLLESAPRGIDVDEVHQMMKETPGVLAVHDLHVWSITTGLDCLSAHVVAAEGQSHTALLKTLRDTLHERFGIGHLTIQIEPEGFEEPATHA